MSKQIKKGIERIEVVDLGEMRERMRLIGGDALRRVLADRHLSALLDEETIRGAEEGLLSFEDVSGIIWGCLS
ncbi:MAG TPA: hypothetical protein VEA41_09845 [Salinarimonas sp.]|nr:hypothetical protein [Salinarimonas sp.]